MRLMELNVTYISSNCHKCLSNIAYIFKGDADMNNIMSSFKIKKEIKNILI